MEFDLAGLQRRTCDFFDFFWLGRAGDWNREERRHIWENAQFPRRLRNGAYIPFYFDQGQYPPARNIHRYYAPGPLQEQQDWMNDAAREADEAELQMTDKYGLISIMREAGFEFKRILGQGGMGVACLFEMTDAYTKRLHKVVVKASTNERGLLSEQQAHKCVEGALHIINRINLNIYGFPTANMSLDTQNQMKRARYNFERRTTKLAIEYMPNGSMRDFLEKTVAQGKRLSDRMLWQILGCLLHGVIGMAYPGLFAQPHMQDDGPLTMLYKEWPTATYPGMPLMVPDKTLVHMDLDEGNVLIGDFDQGDHGPFPLVKIADLGLARMIGSGEMYSPEIWYRRREGKPYTYAPEQFTEEWNDCTQAPRLHPRVQPTAGNFGWWTNVYQVGHVMWCLITQYRQREPPYPMLYNHTSETTGQVTEQWTYGGDVLDARFDHHDRTIRHVVAQCMSHEPRYRPSMKMIMDLLTTRIHWPIDEQEARDTRRWTREIFAGPPPVLQPDAPAFIPGGGAAPYGAPVVPVAPVARPAVAPQPAPAAPAMVTAQVSAPDPTAVPLPVSVSESTPSSSSSMSSPAAPAAPRPASDTPNPTIATPSHHRVRPADQRPVTNPELIRRRRELRLRSNRSLRRISTRRVVDI